MRLALPIVSAEIKQSRNFILWNLAIGHSITHLFFQSFLVIQPFIKSAMGLSDVQFGLLSSVRNVSSGAINIPAGFFTDLVRRQWGLILTGCMLGSAALYGLAGAAPNYALLVLIMVFVAWPGALWHLPAIASLSRRFPERRGYALSIHAMGGSAGNFLGPVVAGLLLGILIWRQVLFLYAVPSVLIGMLVWWSLRELGGRETGRTTQAMGVHFRDSFKMATNSVVMALLLVALLRNMGFQAITTWTPLYLKEEIGLSPATVGLYVGLLTGVGTVSAPLLGHLSDRYGRKAFLLPGLVITAVLAGLLVKAAAWGMAPLTLIFVGMGLFAFSEFQLIQASILDMTGRDREGTATGLLFGLTGMVGAVSPLVAAFVKGGYGMSGIFYYSAILTAASAAVLLFIPLRRPLPVAGSSGEATGSRPN